MVVETTKWTVQKNREAYAILQEIRRESKPDNDKPSRRESKPENDKPSDHSMVACLIRSPEESYLRTSLYH
jgi:hypothetical protein